MTPLITISFDEYNEIKYIKDNFVKAFNENKTILFRDSYFLGNYHANEYTIVNTDVFMDELREKLKKMEEENSKLSQKIVVLKY